MFSNTGCTCKSWKAHQIELRNEKRMKEAERKRADEKSNKEKMN